MEPVRFTDHLFDGLFAASQVFFTVPRMSAKRVRLPTAS